MKFIVRFILLSLFTTLAVGQELSFKDHQLIQMTSDQLNQVASLYPESKPFDEGYLQVSKTHHIYYAQFGNPQGQPVVYLHGGPGSGTRTDVTQFLDPSFYRIILFDQRGAGRSKPHASIEDNTLHHLLDDMVELKKHLKVDKWLISGGSWGSTLGLAYAQAYPDDVQGLILRGVFDGTREHYLHLLYGMKKTYPEAWSEFIAFLPEHERGNLIRAYRSRLNSHDPKIHMPAARAFIKYDTICGMHYPDKQVIDTILKDDETVLGISRIFMHYAYHDFFMRKLQIRMDMNKIQHIPVMMVQGRYDVITPAGNAHKLYRKWPNVALLFVQDAGHFHTEKGIGLGLTAAGDKFKEILQNTA